MSIQMKILSPLAKVFADEKPAEELHLTKVSGFMNETISFQTAYMDDNPGMNDFVCVEVDSPIREAVQVRQVRLVPVGLATWNGGDDDYLRKAPGMYPDLLTDLKEGQVRIHGGQWASLWIDVEPGDFPPGIYPVVIRFRSLQGAVLAECGAEVEVLNARLPKQELRYTRWFHADCLAGYYGVPAFSERHWEIIGNFIRAAIKRGINMILTPVFTPPLDTAVGGERLTTQLVDVTIEGGRYSFGFEKLKRWIGLCRECGVEYLEISHLFTQWGVKHAPKVMATVDGEYRRIFGWETEAASDEYRAFLAAFLTELVLFLKAMSLAGRCYFHISDEPSLRDLENYLTAKSFVAPYLDGFEIVDALSEIDFYNTGALDKPVVCTDHIRAFLDAKVEKLWAYYCCGQVKDVSNQFIAMPSARNRILAVQLYKYAIEGFLHWGYNFYNTQNSTGGVDPYFSTDADGWTPAGDPFQVYPGRDGYPEESIRIMVTAQALNDLRAFKLLESLKGRDFVLGLLEDGTEEPITFSEYPKTDRYLLGLRDRVNREIIGAISGGQ